MIVVVGGNSAGSFAAAQLARDHDVTVFEQDDHFRKVCSGIITAPLFDILPVKKDVILNRFSKVRIHAPNKDFVELHFKKEDVVVDKEAFNRSIAELAIDEGAHFFPKKQFLSFANSSARIRDLSTQKITSVPFTHLIGADGAQSLVAKNAGLLQKREYKLAIKAIVPEKHENCVEFYPFVEEIAWKSPHDENHVEVGVVAPVEKAAGIFNAFVNRLGYANVKKDAALVPVYDSRARIQNDNVFLIGDAAGHVKATTYGGIMQGLKAARALAHAIRTDTSYEKEWRRVLGFDLWLHSLMRTSLNAFTERDWNLLIHYFKKEELVSVLETYSRDYPSAFVMRILFAQPRLLRFATKII